MDLNPAKARNNARKCGTTEKLNTVKSKGGARGGGVEVAEAYIP